MYLLVGGGSAGPVEHGPTVLDVLSALCHTNTHYHTAMHIQYKYYIIVMCTPLFDDLVCSVTCLLWENVTSSESISNLYGWISLLK